MVGGESLGHDVAEQLERLGAVRDRQPRRPPAGARPRACRDVRPMGEGDRHARFRLESGARNALGVAFGVNGDLAEPRLAEPLDVSLRLELNEWQGAVSPRVVLGRALPRAADAPERLRPTPSPGEEEWTRRLDAERERPLDRLAAARAARGGRRGSAREVVDRRGDSGVAAVAGLASSGDAGAGALRRRAPPQGAGRARGGAGALRRRQGRDRLGAAGRRRESRPRRAVAEAGRAFCWPTGLGLPATLDGHAFRPRGDRSIRPVRPPRAPGRSAGAGLPSPRLERGRGGACAPRAPRGVAGPAGRRGRSIARCAPRRRTGPSTGRARSRPAREALPGPAATRARPRSPRDACGCWRSWGRSAGSLRAPLHPSRRILGGQARAARDLHRLP